MPDDKRLRPATSDEIADSLFFALRFDGQRRVIHANVMMARITAEHLVQHLERRGFVLVKKRPAAPPAARHYTPPRS